MGGTYPQRLRPARHRCPRVLLLHCRKVAQRGMGPSPPGIAARENPRHPAADRSLLPYPRTGHEHDGSGQRRHLRCRHLVHRRRWESLGTRPSRSARSPLLTPAPRSPVTRWPGFRIPLPGNQPVRPVAPTATGLTPVRRRGCQRAVVSSSIRRPAARWYSARTRSRRGGWERRTTASRQSFPPLPRSCQASSPGR
jgi:hypothetical protein